MPRGHSNVFDLHTIEKYPGLNKVKIPIMGGASVRTVKDLPPLALSEEEWREIGSRAGWLKEEA